MDLGLNDRVVVISGASRGIGLAIARVFVTEGALVAVTARGSAALEEARTALARISGPERVIAITADMTRPDAIASTCRAVVDAWGRIDITVANIGSGTGKLLLEASAAEWQQSLERNLLGSVELSRAVVPYMQLERSGALLFISSIVGVEAVSAPLPYVAAKSALQAVAKNLARAVAADGIRVNVLSPGNVLFPVGMWARKVENAPDSVRGYIEREVPMKRFGTVEEIAEVAVFMCSARAGFMTRATVVVDGGQTRTY